MQNIAFIWTSISGYLTLVDDTNKVGLIDNYN